MLIRPRRPNDLPALERIGRAVHELDGYPPYLPDGDVRGFVASDEAIGSWVAVADDAVVGQISLHTGSSPGVVELASAELDVDRDRCGVIARLLVSPEVRRSGIGRRLLDHAAADARERGLVPILDVVDRFAPAIRLYEEAGWTRLGTVDVDLPDGTMITEHIYAAPDTR